MTKQSIFRALAVLSLVLTACGGAARTADPTEPGGATTTQKGGEMIAAYKDDLAPLDPAIGYDWTNWPAIKLVFDGLLDYDSGTTLMPRLAESMPTVNADGTVYTFKLRKGVQFSNGREFTADDVVYTITRVLD